MYKIILISFSIIMLGVLIAGCAELIKAKKGLSFVEADNPAIVYSGRIDFTNMKAPSFDWPGITIQANFEGGYIGAKIKDGNNDYNVFIDGKPESIVVTRQGVEDYTLADKLGPGRHLLTISRRGEGYQGIAVFKGLTLEKDGKLLAPPELPKRKIEYIGDSITVGYGVEGISTSCPSEREFKNNWKAFSAVAARELGAEYHMIAISGRGVVRNYNEKAKTSAEPLPFYYERTLQNEGKTMWDFKSWVPDAVVVNLGANDFSTDPKPDKDVFIKAYIALVKKVRGYYPGAQVFCCMGPTQLPPFKSYLEEILAELSKDKNIHRVDLNNMADDELGCDWHPNVKAAQRLAGELARQVRPIMKW